MLTLSWILSSGGSDSGFPDTDIRPEAKNWASDVYLNPSPRKGENVPPLADRSKAEVEAVR